MFLFRIFILIFCATPLYAQVISLQCNGELITNEGEKIIMKTVIDLNLKSKKGCALFTPGGRGHHCFDFDASENLYTLHNGQKSHAGAFNLFGFPDGIVTHTTSDAVINRKTAIMTVTNATADARSHRVVSSTVLKSECQKSGNNGLMTGNKL